MTDRRTACVGIIARRRTEALERTARLVRAQLRAGDRLLVAVERPEPALPAPELEREDGPVSWLALPAGRGFGYNRNRVLEATAPGRVVVFVDDDCEPADDWLERLLAPLEDPSIDAVVGRVEVPRSSFVGDSISALGFPAGGHLGFEVMFPVDERGRTSNLATGNCALRRATLERVGGFDETMLSGGEDTELAHRLVAAGAAIRYEPSARVVHPARTSLVEFCRWFFRRGRAKYQFARRVPAVGGYVRRRLASAWQVLWLNRRRPHLVLIAPLLALSLLLQQAGFVWEALTDARRRPPGSATSSRP